MSSATSISVRLNAPTTTAGRSSDNKAVDVVGTAATPSSLICNGSSEFVGGSSASFATLDQLLAKSRRFSVDLLPRLLFSKSPVIDTLVRSGVNRYLEFKAVDACYMWANDSLTRVSFDRFANCLNKIIVDASSIIQVPSSKSDMFRDESLSLLQKRALMKFFTTLNTDDGARELCGSSLPAAVESPSAQLTAFSALRSATEQRRCDARCSEARQYRGGVHKACHRVTACKRNTIRRVVGSIVRTYNERLLHSRIRNNHHRRRRRYRHRRRRALRAVVDTSDRSASLARVSVDFFVAKNNSNNNLINYFRSGFQRR